MNRLVTDLKYKPDKVTFLTDSKICLGYINNEDKCFKKYVSRRVALIRKLSNPSDWKYVTSKDNIADRASRPCTPKELLQSDWVKGPSFLYEPEFWTHKANDGIESFAFSLPNTTLASLYPFFPCNRSAEYHLVVLSTQNPRPATVIARWSVKLSCEWRLKQHG